MQLRKCSSSIVCSKRFYSSFFGIKEVVQVESSIEVEENPFENEGPLSG